MHKWYKILMMVLAVAISTVAMAQTDNGDVGVMRSAGKIYVVLAVVLTVLIGLLLFVIRLDRKISKLEKEGV